MRRIGASILCVAALALTTSIAPPALANQTGAPPPDCTPAWHFDTLAPKSAMIGQVGPTFSSYHQNGGSETYSAGITGTVAASFSSSLEVGASAATLAQIKASVNGSLAASVAVSASLAVTQPVPVAYWGNGRYGRYRTVVTGHSYHTTSACSSDVDHGRITAYAAGTANAQGWCLWISTAAAASVPVQCYNGSKFQA